MSLIQILQKLRDDIKAWVTINIKALDSKIGDETVSTQIANAISSQKHFSGDYNDLINAPDIMEDESGNYVIADEEGNVIFRVDENGVHTTELSLGGEAVATEKYVNESLLEVDIDLPLERGAGTEAIQQTPNGVADGIPFAGENPNAEALDDSLSGVQPYGAVGAFSSAFGGKSSAQGKRSLAEGTTTIAKGGYSHAEGNNSVTLGANSHAEGRQTVAKGENSHSEGYNTQAQGDHSHSEGQNTITVGAAAHAEGFETIANGEYSHAEGETTRALSWGSHSEGLRTLASNAAAHAEGADTQATAAAAHAEGGGTQATAQYSHAEGVNTLAQGDESHAEGMATIAYAPASHAEGNNTRAIADHSHAEGNATEAEGVNSHAEGSQTAARAWASHAEGEATKALGNSSHAEGLRSESRGAYSHAGGVDTIAEGDYSFATGWQVTTAKTAQAVVGRGNVANPDAMFVVGAADFDEENYQLLDYRNCFTTGYDGQESYVTIGGTKLTESKLVYLLSLEEKIGDIDAALDAIIEMQNSLIPKNPTFTLDIDYIGRGTHTVEFEEGMTWSDWIASSYNTYNVVEYMECPCVDAGNWNMHFIRLGDNSVNLTDVIAEGCYYSISF